MAGTRRHRASSATGRRRRPVSRRVRGPALVRRSRWSCSIVSARSSSVGLVAHNSGSGWVQALGDVAGRHAPARAPRPGRRVCPGRASGSSAAPTTPPPAGRSRSRRGCRTTPVRLRPVDPRRARGLRSDPPAGATAPTRPTRSPSCPDRRGVLDQVIARRRHRRPLRAAVVDAGGCVLALPGRAARRSPARAGRRRCRGRTTTGRRQRPPVPRRRRRAPRGARPYRPGDSRRRVHWPATAHSGELMVREMEGPTAEPVAVVVALPADDDAAERWPNGPSAPGGRSSTGARRSCSPPSRRRPPHRRRGRPPLGRPPAGPGRGARRAPAASAPTDVA